MLIEPLPVADGLAAGLLLLARVVHLGKMPAASCRRTRSRKAPDYIAGKDLAAGFVNLLRRSIAPRDLLPVCFAEWKKSAGSAGKYSAARRQNLARLEFSTRKNPCGPRTGTLSPSGKISAPFWEPAMHHQNQ